MRQVQNNTKRRRFKHFTEKERYKLEALLAKKVKVSEISELLGKHKATIYREIARGKSLRLTPEWIEREMYRADVAEQKYRERVANRERSLKIGKDHKLAEYITKKIIEDQFSPDAVLGKIDQQGLPFQTRICTKTLYNYIDRGLFHGITNENLWEKGRRKKKKHRRVRVSFTNRLGRNISERPVGIENREEYGHWEIDCVKSGMKKGKAVLLTLTERKSREEKIIKLPSATEKEVDKALTKLEHHYKENFAYKFKSLTADNGSEFLDWQTLESSKLFEGRKRTIIYFAHPYSSWERGSNENQNRMIRRFVPKGSDISKISERTIKEIEDWMNNYPRKILEYNSPNDMVRKLTENMNLANVSQ